MEICQRVHSVLDFVSSHNDSFGDPSTRTTEFCRLIQYRKLIFSGLSHFESVHARVCVSPPGRRRPLPVPHDALAST